MALTTTLVIGAAAIGIAAIGAALKVKGKSGK